MVTKEEKLARYGVFEAIFDEEFEYDDIRSGDVVIFKNTVWRVVAPVGNYTRKFGDQKQIGLSILGSPGLGGWKLPRHIESHCPRERWEANEVEETDEKQKRLVVSVEEAEE